MRNFIIRILIVIVGYLALLAWFTHGRVYLENDSNTKVVTIYRPFYTFYNKFFTPSSYFYVMPYKYTSLLPPINNYAIYGSFERNNFGIAIDWNPINKKYLRISNWNLKLNKFHKNIELYSVGKEDKADYYQITDSLEGGWDSMGMSEINNFGTGMIAKILTLLIMFIFVVIIIIGLVDLTNYLSKNKDLK